jgi:hypothetical protein
MKNNKKTTKKNRKSQIIKPVAIKYDPNNDQFAGKIGALNNSMSLHFSTDFKKDSQGLSEKDARRLS